MRQARIGVGRLHSRIADASLRMQPTAELKCELRDLQDARDIVRARRREIPTHCRAGDLDETEQLDALPARERRVLMKEYFTATLEASREVQRNVTYLRRECLTERGVQTRLRLVY